jgi:hypothetical protein
MLSTKNCPTPNEIMDLFKSSSKDDWIKGDENDDAAFGHRRKLLITLWRHPQGYELRYGYQCVAIVGEPGSGNIIQVVDDTVVLVS